MTIWNVFEVDKCLSAEVRFIIVSFNSRHTIFEQMLHSLRYSIVVVLSLLVCIIKSLIVLKERLEILQLISRYKLLVGFVVV